MPDTLTPFSAQEVLTMLASPIGSHEIPKSGHVFINKRRYLLRIEDHSGSSLEPRSLVLLDQGPGKKVNIVCHCDHKKQR